jgi:hypothetical protein
MTRRYLYNLLACFFVLLIISSGSSALNIKPDETLVFYPTVASFQKDTGSWIVPVHAHVFEREMDSTFRRVIIESLQKKYNINNPVQSDVFNKRMTLFMVDNEGWKQVHIKIGHLEFTLHNTSVNGHAEQNVTVSDSDMKQILKQSVSQNRITVEAILPAGDKRQFNGMIFLPGDKPLFLISDIDDTIKISDVRNKKELMKNTFMNPFKPVPGMSDFYRTMAGKGAIIYYISASPWQLYSEFAEFLKIESFPDGAFCLKYIRLKDTDFFNIFVKGFEYKLASIEPVLKRFPKGEFILVGDSGEMDPEAYGVLASKYPENIKKIIIRNAYNQDEPDRYAKAFKNVPKKKWQIIKDAGEININK